MRSVKKAKKLAGDALPWTLPETDFNVHEDEVRNAGITAGKKYLGDWERYDPEPTLTGKFIRYVLVPLTRIIEAHTFVNHNLTTTTDGYEFRIPQYAVFVLQNLPKNGIFNPLVPKGRERREQLIECLLGEKIIINGEDMLGHDTTRAITKAVKSSVRNQERRRSFSVSTDTEPEPRPRPKGRTRSKSCDHGKRQDRNDSERVKFGGTLKVPTKGRPRRKTIDSLCPCKQKLPRPANTKTYELWNSTLGCAGNAAMLWIHPQKGQGPWNGDILIMQYSSNDDRCEIRARKDANGEITKCLIRLKPGSSLARLAEVEEGEVYPRSSFQDFHTWRDDQKKHKFLPVRDFEIMHKDGAIYERFVLIPHNVVQIEVAPLEGDWDEDLQ